MKPHWLLIGCTLAAAAQAQPLNQETQAHYEAQTAAVQPQLPLKLNRFLTVKAVSFHNGGTHVLYETAAAASGEEVQNAVDAVRQSSRQAYYLDVCGNRPPLQIISNSHWVQDAAGKLVARWANTPEMCASEEARQAHEKGAQQGRIVRKNVRIDESSVKNGVMSATYTLTDRDFNDIATMLPFAVNAMKKQVSAIVCRPEGGMLHGLQAARFIVRDKHGKAMPPVDISPIDCMPQPAAEPQESEGRPRRKAKG